MSFLSFVFQQYYSTFALAEKIPAQALVRFATDTREGSGASLFLSSLKQQKNNGAHDFIRIPSGDAQ